MDGVSASLDPDLLLCMMYVRKEAVLSSQIEGAQSTLIDLLQYENAEAPGVPEEDVREVSRYVAALQHGFDWMRTGMPISLRLIREAHGVLLTGARGGHQAPGEFRRNQNWIGGSHPSRRASCRPRPTRCWRRWTTGSRHLLRDWWQRAESAAGLDTEPRRGWHSLRRKFATEMKHTPLKDLCALGGWKDHQTLLTCYQRTDAVTMRAALDQRMRLQG